MKERFFRRWRIQLVLCQGKAKSLSRLLVKQAGLELLQLVRILLRNYLKLLDRKERKGPSCNVERKTTSQLAPEDLRSPALTAEWEQKLTAIAKGKLPQQAFIDEMSTYAKEIVP